MKLITRFIDLVLYTSLFTACCATGLCMATERFINGWSPALASPLHLLVFGSTLLVYNAPRIFRKPRPSGRQPYRGWYFLFFFTGLAMVAATLLRLSGELLVCCVLLAMLTFAYSLPLLPFKNKKRLREFGWLKILVLAGVWTIVTSVLPILYYNKNTGDYPFEILLRFVFIFTLCMIFDIRDMHADLRNRIDTLPHKVGIKNSYRLINTTLILFAALSVLQYMRYPVASRLAGDLLTAVITWLVVTYLRKKPSERAYLALADGVMLVYALFVLWH